MRQKIPMLGWVVLAACAAPAPRPQTANAPSNGATATGSGAVPQARAPHKCVRSVYPTYRTAEEVAAEAAEQAEWEAANGGADKTADEVPDDVPADGVGFDENGGWTLREKAAALAKSTPMQGVCDTRHRSELEAALLRLPARGPGEVRRLMHLQTEQEPGWPLPHRLAGGCPARWSHWQPQSGHTHAGAPWPRHWCTHCRSDRCDPAPQRSAHLPLQPPKTTT